jgi:urease accessory protein
MPLETIFFNGGKLRRRLNIDLKPSSNFFAVETLIFGRQAMGEIVESGELDDALQIYKNNKLLYSDFNKIKGNIDKKILKSLVSKGNNIFCNIVYTGKKMRIYEKQILKYADKSKYFFGVSIVNGVLLLKILASNIKDIRDFLSDLVKIFGKNFNLPRIWGF